jgi:hypothetical protein
MYTKPFLIYVKGNALHPIHLFLHSEAANALKEGS